MKGVCTFVLEDDWDQVKYAIHIPKPNPLPKTYVFGSCS